VAISADDHACLRVAMGEFPFEDAYGSGQRLKAEQATQLAQESLARVVAGTPQDCGTDPTKFRFERAGRLKA
jgi:hypothetical protein